MRYQNQTEKNGETSYTEERKTVLPETTQYQSPSQQNQFFDSQFKKRSEREKPENGTSESYCKLVNEKNLLRDKIRKLENQPSLRLNSRLKSTTAIYIVALNNSSEEIETKSLIEKSLAQKNEKSELGSLQKELEKKSKENEAYKLAFEEVKKMFNVTKENLSFSFNKYENDEVKCIYELLKNKLKNEKEINLKIVEKYEKIIRELSKSVQGLKERLKKMAEKKGKIQNLECFDREKVIRFAGDLNRCSEELHQVVSAKQEPENVMLCRIKPIIHSIEQSIEEFKLGQ